MQTQSPTISMWGLACDVGPTKSCSRAVARFLPKVSSVKRSYMVRVHTSHIESLNCLCRAARAVQPRSVCAKLNELASKHDEEVAEGLGPVACSHLGLTVLIVSFLMLPCAGKAAVQRLSFMPLSVQQSSCDTPGSPACIGRRARQTLLLPG